MICVKNFSKAYDDVLAVDDLSFTVKPGQILGLVGRNGAGKTTTLRSINGIIPLSAGEISVGDFDLAKQPIEVKRRTAYVPDDPQLFEDLTVEQHLLFQASVYQIEDPAPKMTSLLERFELAGKRRSRASSLSRGMRQKLAIACAYLQQPSALLLDEPMTGLDPPAIRVLKQTIVEQSQRGAAIMISSHLLAMVEDICSHVLVLDHGRKRFDGSLSELREQYLEAQSGKSLEDAFFTALGNAENAIAEELSHSQAVNAS